MYILLTRENCNICEITKKFIDNNTLKIKYKEAEKDTIEILKNAGIENYPILIDDMEKDGFKIIENGENVENYLLNNIEKYK